jgi:hypothetical protein
MIFVCGCVGTMGALPQDNLADADSNGNQDVDISPDSDTDHDHEADADIATDADIEADTDVSVDDGGADADSGDADVEVDVDSDADADLEDGAVDGDMGEADADEDVEVEVVGGDETDADIDEPDPIEEGPCQLFTDGVELGRVNIAGLDEISGVVESRSHRGVLYLHNDSGIRLSFFATETNGTRLGEFRSDDIDPRDLEDMSIGPGPDGSDWIYLGDIGDNSAVRDEIQVYRIAEPSSLATAEAVTLSGWQRLRFVYPDHPHNSETMFIEPSSGDIYILTKESDGVSDLVVARAPHTPDSVVTLEHLITLRFGEGALGGSNRTTGGDISPAGDSILVRTYSRVFLWIREPGASIAEAMAGTVFSLPRRNEPQGESIGFAADGRGYFTISEGIDVPVYFFAAGAPCN